MCPPFGLSMHHPSPGMQKRINTLRILQSGHTEDIAFWLCWIWPPFWRRLKFLHIDAIGNMDNLLSAKSIGGKIGMAACTQNLIEGVRVPQEVQDRTAT